MKNSRCERWSRHGGGANLFNFPCGQADEYR